MRTKCCGIYYTTARCGDCPSPSTGGNALPVQALQHHYGWICPKCGTVHAPTVLQCLCNMQITLGTSANG